MFILEYDSLFNYINGDINKELGKWHNVISCKYIVSTLKAFNLYSRYISGNENEKKYILSLVQQVVSGTRDLEDVLEVLGVTYDNSLEQEHVISLIYR